jgi:translocation and assembly module TamB
MIRIWAVLAVMMALILPGAAPAQSTDDRSRIVRFLEDQLSSGARQVSITGFRGALSARAEMDLLTIADDDGIWLRLEGARLDWSRAALLRGALQIDALHADRLQVLRAPLPEPGLDLPAAEATPFRLPQLPVSISIGRVSLDRVALGEELLGVAVELSVAGGATLVKGAGQADLDITRLDGPEGRFALAVGYANDTGQLDLSLVLAEAAGGLLATRLAIPDAPAIGFSATGSGPIDKFTAQIALESDGAPRLRGTVATARDEQTNLRRITADVGGDITPLFLPDYRPFFGPEVALTTQIQLLPDGAVTLDRLHLTAAKLSIDGALAMAPGGAPSAFDLTLRMADPSGQGPVRLPVPGGNVTVGQADLTLRYDAAQGDGYTAQGVISDLDTGALKVVRIGLEASGVLSPGENGLRLDAPLALEVAGLTHRDPAWARALGADGQFRARVLWAEGTPISIRDLSVQSGDLRLTGVAALGIDTGDTPLTLDTDLALDVARLERFAPLAGQPLAGRLAANLALRADLLSGAFDMVLTGAGRDLALSDALPPGLFMGDTDVTLSAIRDEAGLVLRDLKLSGDQVDLDVEGRVNSDGALIAGTGRLADIGLFTDTLQGPVTAEMGATRGPGGAAPWRLRADVASAAGLTGTVAGSITDSGEAVDLTARGQLPLALANRALAPQSLFGTLAFDLAMQGKPGLAAISGRLRTTDGRLTLPVVQTALENLQAQAEVAGGQISLTATGDLASGGRVTGTGSIRVDRPGLPAQIALSGRGVRLVDPNLYDARIDQADIRLTGALTGALQVAGTLALGETNLRVPESGLGASAPIPPITHLDETPPEQRTRIAAGLGPSQTQAGGSQRIGMDLSITAPGRVFIRGRGVDAELGGNLRIGGTTAQVIPAGRLNLIRGRLSVLGRRLDLTEGSATLEGNFDPLIRLLASARAGDYQIGISLTGPLSAPTIALSSSPALPEDEILAQLLFGRAVSALSPVQVLQLADAATGLAGGSSQGGLLANLREGLGLDDLDLQTDSQGNAALRAGRYLSENVYTDVTIGGDGGADISLNIDLTPDITARGSFSAVGDTSLGVFFERDY